MLIHSPSLALFSQNTSLHLGAVKSHKSSSTSAIINNRSSSSCNLTITSLFAACAVLASAAGAIEAPQQAETLSNIPQTLSGVCASPKDCKKPRIQRPNSRKAESCTIKCVNTCIRGGEGSPGEGPLNIRRSFNLLTAFLYQFFVFKIGAKVNSGNNTLPEIGTCAISLFTFKCVKM